MSRTTLHQAFRRILAESYMTQAGALADFGKPIDQITNDDLVKTLNREAIASLQKFAREMDRRKSVAGQFKRRIKRKGGRP